MNSSDDRVADVIHQALRHPIRRRILLILKIEEKPMSPVDLVFHIEGTKEQNKLSEISYHVRELEKAGLVTLVGTEAVRGTTKHFYIPSKLFTADLLDALALDAIAELLEDATSGEAEGVIDKIIEVLAASGRPIRPLGPSGS